MNVMALINKVLVKFGIKDPVKVEQAYNLKTDAAEWLAQVGAEEAQELLEMELDLKVGQLDRAMDLYRVASPVVIREELNTPERNKEANHVLAWMLLEEAAASYEELAEDVNCYVEE